MNCWCGAVETGPKYRDDGFRYFHVYECSEGHVRNEQRPHSEWLENQKAMRELDDRDCQKIGGGFNFGRVR